MDIIGKRKIWFAISLVLILISIISLFTWGLKLGVDFKGGTILDLTCKDIIETNKFDQQLTTLDYTKDNYNIIKTGDYSIFIRTLPLEKEQIEEIKSKINQEIGDCQETKLETVGPTISNSLKKKAILAVILASLAIVLYIAYAFKSVPKPASSWRFGISAIIALLHDLIITIGIFSILGYYYGFEVDSYFITALLTVMGFSVHDTIVVFDRVRENLTRYPSKNFSTNVNNSVVQTLTRSLNTSLTLILVLLALLLLGGQSTLPLVITLLIGVTVGTYSSIFTASPILVVWQNWLQAKQNK